MGVVDTTTTYVVRFERIGRNHDAPDLTATVSAGDFDALAEEVYRYTRRFLGSRDYSVTISANEDGTDPRGSIEFGRFGRFTIEAAS